MFYEISESSLIFLLIFLSEKHRTFFDQLLYKILYFLWIVSDVRKDKEISKRVDKCRATITTFLPIKSLL